MFGKRRCQAIRAQFKIKVSQLESQVEITAGSSIVVGAHRVTLVRVEPERTTLDPSAPQDYRVTLRIDRVD